MSPRVRRMALAALLAVALVAGVVVAVRSTSGAGRTQVTAYFENSNGIYPGDEVRILGVPVGEVATIEPQPRQAKITFWVDDQYRIPADAKAVILSPSVVSARAIQLTPAYTGGPVLADHAVIPRDRTAVPVEWDDLRTQLDRLSQTLQPTEPGGVSTMGSFVNTVADNLRGQGADIRRTVIKLSQSLSILGDHSGDIFGTVKNLAILVSALRDSTDLMRQLNTNFAAVTTLLADDPGAVGRAISDLNTALTDVRGFVADNKEPLGTSFDKLAQIASALGGSLDDIKQALHMFPNSIQNYANIYQPAQGDAPTGAIAGSNFANPIQFICSAVQAASRLNAEQSAKLCVQYLAPIVKNRQYNFLGPIGMNPLVGASARPNEVTYSEDWMRPDYVPPAAPVPADAAAQGPAPAGTQPALPAEAPGSSDPVATNPGAGLTGMMMPGGAGS